MLLPSRLVQQGAPGQEPTFQKTLQFRVTSPPDLPSLERGHLAGHSARDLGVVLAPKPPPLPFQSDSQWSCVKPELMSVQSRGRASPHLQNPMLRAGASEWGQGGVMVSGHSSHAGLGFSWSCSQLSTSPDLCTGRSCCLANSTVRGQLCHLLLRETLPDLPYLHLDPFTSQPLSPQVTTGIIR